MSEAFLKIKSFLKRYYVLIEHMYKYAVWGFSSFLFELFLLWIFIDVFGFHYVLGIIFSFIVATSLQYCGVRWHAFQNTERSYRDAYIWFIGVAILSIISVTILVMILVEILNMPVYVSRILAAGVVGIQSFLMQRRFTFKIK